MIIFINKLFIADKFDGIKFEHMEAGPKGEGQNARNKRRGGEGILCYVIDYAFCISKIETGLSIDFDEVTLSTLAGCQLLSVLLTR